MYNSNPLVKIFALLIASFLFLAIGSVDEAIKTIAISLVSALAYWIEISKSDGLNYYNYGRINKFIFI